MFNSREKHVFSVRLNEIHITVAPMNDQPGQVVLPSRRQRKDERYSSFDLNYNYHNMDKYFS